MADILCKFGERVKKFRLQKGFSQGEFAELAGVHRTYIVNVEAGKRNISLKNVEKIAKALKLKPKDLLDI